MSGLLHLVEAATALTKLGPSNLPPSTVYQAATSTTSQQPIPVLTAPALSRRASTHTISDDDDTTTTAAVHKASSCPKITTLRENHLQALRAAAVNAGLVVVNRHAHHAVAAPTAQLASAYHAACMSHHPAPVVAGGSGAPVSVSPPFPQQVTTTTTTTATTTTTINNIIRPRGSDTTTKEMFPLRLHALLADPNVRDVISWLPHGKSFVVLRPDVFATRVLPMYFAPEGSNSLNAKAASSSSAAAVVKNKNKSQVGVHKYPSFTRKLNRWGFRQISRGPDAGAFCHELFQRDDPELCRGMVCQKSRKSSSNSKKAGLPQQQQDNNDLMSVSSASTMGTRSVASSSYYCENKRPICSSTVTVSTAGNASNKSLPFKKRKSGHHHPHNVITNNNNNYNNMVNDIPSMISHRYQKMAPSTSSMTESDMTSSDNGSVCSAPKTAAAAAPNNNRAAPVPPAAPPAADAAREALARHFHEQHRAFALASLMENSRLAMRAAGIPNRPRSLASTNNGAPLPVVVRRQIHPHGREYPPVLGAVTTHSPTVLAHTVCIPEDNKKKKMSSGSGAANAPAASISSAEAAKSALYKAYLQALSNNNNNAAAAARSS